MHLAVDYTISDADKVRKKVHYCSGVSMITVIGAANADIQAFVSRRLTPGDSSPGRISTSAGGVARNIAHNLRLLGDRVDFITALADDENSKILVSGMTALGIDFSKSAVMPGARTSSYVCILDEKGVLFGAVADMEIIESLPADTVEIALADLEKGDLVIVDTNVREEVLAAAARATARAGALLVADTVSEAKCVRCKPILPFLHAVKPNRGETLVLTGVEVTDTASARKAADFFHAKGIRCVCISLGRDGVFWSGDGRHGRIAVAGMPVLNVSGAGDALTAGLVSALAEGAGLEDAVRFAQACASITCASEKTVSDSLSRDGARAIARSLRSIYSEGAYS